MPDQLNPAKGIYDVLKAHSPSLETGSWIIATSRLGSSPDKQVVVINSGGRRPEPVIAQNYPSIQLIVRGAKGPGGNDDAYVQAVKCRNALLGIPSSPAAYPELASVTGIGDVTPLGYDDAERPMYSVNLQLITSHETSGYREAI